MQLRFPILVIFFSSKILNVSGKCRPSTYSISGFHLSGHVMSTMIVFSLSECLNTCVTKFRCRSLNFCSKDKSCDLNDARRHVHPEDYGPKAGCIYIDVSESPKVCPFNIFPMIKHIPNVKINSVLIYLNLSLSVWKNELVKIMIESQFDARHEKQTISFFFLFFFFFSNWEPSKRFYSFKSCAAIQQECLRRKVDIIG